MDDTNGLEFEVISSKYISNKLLVSLMQLPDDFKGICFIDRRCGVDAKDLIDLCKKLEIKSKVGFIFASDVDQIKLIPID